VTRRRRRKTTRRVKAMRKVETRVEKKRKRRTSKKRQSGMRQCQKTDIVKCASGILPILSPFSFSGTITNGLAF